MVIKASSSREVDALASDLASPSALKRDGAIARLAVIGARAVGRVLDVATDRSSPVIARAAAFRALEAIADSRALAPALAATADPDAGVAAAAVGVARVFLNDPADVNALDHVTAVALDRERPRSVRLAAIRALLDLDASTIAPVIATLAADPDAAIAGAVNPDGRRRAISAAGRLEEAAAGRLGDDPAAIRRALTGAAHELTPSALHQIVEHVRIREGTEPTDRRAEWMSVRAAAHHALARRGSRLALYDLRETVSTAKAPLAADFLSALAAIGEASCLEATANAYAHAASDKRADEWWRRSLADAFRAIAGRERITRRSAAVKRIEKKWPGLFESLVRKA
jgi:hypothetical protein